MAYDRFALTLGPPHGLRCASGLVHVAVSALLVRGMADGLEPAPALWIVCAAVLANALREDRRIRRAPRRVSVWGSEAHVDAHPTAFRLDYVGCAHRWCVLAALVASSGERVWLLAGPRQLPEPALRRLLRWLRERGRG